MATMKHFQNTVTALLLGMALLGCSRPPANQPIPPAGQAEAAKMPVENSAAVPSLDAPVSAEELVPSPNLFPAVPQISESELSANPTIAPTRSWTPASETLSKVAMGDAEAIRFQGFGSCRLVLIQAYKKRINRFSEQPTADDLLSALAVAAVPLDSTGNPWQTSIAPTVEAAEDRAISLILTDTEMVLVHRFDKAPHKHRSHIKRAEFNDEPAGTAGNWPEALAEVQVLQIELLLRQYVGAFGHFPESLGDLMSTFNMALPKGLLDTGVNASRTGTLTLYANPQTMSYRIGGGNLPESMARRVVTFKLNSEKGEVETVAHQLAEGVPMDNLVPFATFPTR